MSFGAGYLRDRCPQAFPVRVGLIVVAALLLGVASGVPAHPARAHTDVTPDQNCTLIVPANPLTAAGLATPYQLTNTDAGQTCNEANPNQSAFVQAVIFDPATNSLAVYPPLVIDQGTVPAIAPVPPAVPGGAVVALWFGFNATNLTLADTNAGATLAGANCVNGVPGSVFGQFAYCNAVAFFAAVNSAIAHGHLSVPVLGMANDGQACPTVRDFFVVDQDQSDNVQTTYLANGAGQTAQNTAANRALLGVAATQLGNPSDNALVSKILDPALGCTPWTVNDLSDPGQQQPALPLDELQAIASQRTPEAQVPAGDPMVLVGGSPDLTKLNAYRAGVDQVLVTNLGQADTARYCREMLRIQPQRLLLDQAQLSGPSPAPTVATTLFNFLVARFSGSYAILNCLALTGLPDPSVLTVNGGGVVTAATFDPTILANDLSSIAPLQAADFAADVSQRDAAAGNILSTTSPSQPQTAGAPPANTGLGIVTMSITIVGCGKTTPSGVSAYAFQNVVVKAVPCSGSVFVGWTGGPCDKTRTNPCSIPAGVAVTANFAP